MPIDIVVDGTPYVVHDNADFQNFVIPLPSAPGSAQFDPGQWILDGTVTKVGYVPGGPKIVETSPAPGAVLGLQMLPRQIVVRFHTPVNAQASNFTLQGERAGAIPFTMSSGSNVDTVTLTVNGALQPDLYTLTVKDAIVAVDSGKALDGEMTNSESAAS